MIGYCDWNTPQLSLDGYEPPKKFDPEVRGLTFISRLKLKNLIEAQRLEPFDWFRGLKTRGSLDVHFTKNVTSPTKRKREDEDSKNAHIVPVIPTTLLSIDYTTLFKFSTEITL